MKEPFRGRTIFGYWCVSPDVWESHLDYYEPGVKYEFPRGTLVDYDQRSGCAILVGGDHKGWIAPFIHSPHGFKPISVLERLAMEAE